MTKKLVIIRHGEAAYFTGMPDIERNLTDNGSIQNIHIAEKILQKDCIPEYLISSNAKRALDTAKIFANTWNVPIDTIEIRPEIYEASVSNLLDVLYSLNNSYNHAVIFGHNPGLSELAEYLTGLNFDLSTSSALVLEFDIINWADISANTGKPALYLEP